MDTISRRHVLTGTAGIALSTLLPMPVLALATADGIEERLHIARELLADLEMESTTCSLYESLCDARPGWNLHWEQSYMAMIAIADDLRQSITDDTPETRAILAKARIIMPPPCERAATYWQPIPNLSRKFRKAFARYYDLRAAYLDLRGDMNPKFYNAWTTIQGDVLCLRVKTTGDRELQRRVLQASGHDDLLDMVWLHTHGAAWPSFIHDSFSKRCVALPCTRCSEWFA